MNLLRQTVKSLYDFDKLANYKKTKVFLCATNVRTAKLKIFKEEEVTLDAMMASACLPTMFHAVHIDGEDYWDGGFIGNPAIFPLIYDCESTDIIVILLTPQFRGHTPKTMPEIRHRLTELSLINSLTREMRSIHFITDLMDKGLADEKKLKRLNMHIVENPDIFQNLDCTSPLNSDWDFLNYLFHEGHKTGKAWLAKNFNDIGKKSTADLVKEFV